MRLELFVAELGVVVYEAVERPQGRLELLNKAVDWSEVSRLESRVLWRLIRSRHKYIVLVHAHVKSASPLIMTEEDRLIDLEYKPSGRALTIPTDPSPKALELTVY